MSEKWDGLKTVAADLVVSQTTMIHLLFSINYFFLNCFKDCCVISVDVYDFN